MNSLNDQLVRPSAHAKLPITPNSPLLTSKALTQNAQMTKGKCVNLKIFEIHIKKKYFTKVSYRNSGKMMASMPECVDFSESPH